MSATAAHKVRVYCAATATPSGSSSNLIAGINDATYNEMVDQLDVTTFKTASVAARKKRIAALLDSAFSLSGDYESSDTPQALIRSSMRTGADLYVGIIFDSAASAGSKGFEAPCQVESFEVSGSVADKVQFSCSLKGNGDVTLL